MNKIGELRYKHQPFFSIRFNHSLYGFSCGFAREELKYLLPFPNMPQHDTFIMLSAQWRKKLHYIDDICAMHRWSDVHNVSRTTNTNNIPIYVKIYYRSIIMCTAIWRGFFIK